MREIINSRCENIWVITCFWGASGFFGGPVDFLIHWPPGPVVATVQCQGLKLPCIIMLFAAGVSYDFSITPH